MAPIVPPCRSFLPLSSPLTRECATPGGWRRSKLSAWNYSWKVGGKRYSTTSKDCYWTFYLPLDSPLTFVVGPFRVNKSLKKTLGIDQFRNHNSEWRPSRLPVLCFCPYLRPRLENVQLLGHLAWNHPRNDAENDIRPFSSTSKKGDPPSVSPLRTKTRIAIRPQVHPWERKKGKRWKKRIQSHQWRRFQPTLARRNRFARWKMKRDSISTDDELNFDFDFLFCLFFLRQVRNEPGTRMPSMRNADETRRRFHPKRFIRFRLVFATSLPSFT